MKNTHLTLTPENIRERIEIAYPDCRIYIDRSSIGKNADEKQKYNLFALARSNKNVKALVVELVNQGYYMVGHENGISIFEKYVSATRFRHNFTSDNVQVYNDLFYTLEKPRINSTTPKLLIVFSSVADSPLNASIFRRNFFANFQSVGKYIPQDTYVLRISDIGSVAGSFYLNNNFNNNIERDILELTEHVILKSGIAKSDVVLYGASKGGSAALYYGIAGDYKAVAIDPIVSDEYHEIKYNDSHFTQGTFPETKQNIFTNLMRNSHISDNINIIYSENSPIYPYINDVIRDNDKHERINYFNVVHPKIKDHPDIVPNTINILTTILNTLYYELVTLGSKRLVLEE